MAENMLEQMKEAVRRYMSAKKVVGEHGNSLHKSSRSTYTSSDSMALVGDELYYALLNLSEPLARSYMQIRLDLNDGSRLSWAGTAHEIREILIGILRMLAPDEVVRAQPWFVQEPRTSGPTHKQKARYILEQRGSGSKEQEVVQQVETIEAMVGNLVRASYSRASDAAHRFKSHTEARRLFNYFVAFAHDLLDVKYTLPK